MLGHLGTLRESSTNQPIGTLRMPLLDILTEHVEKTYEHNLLPLTCGHSGGPTTLLATPTGHRFGARRTF